MSLKGPFPIDWSTIDLNDPEAVKAILRHPCLQQAGLQSCGSPVSRKPRLKRRKSKTKGSNQPIERRKR